MDHIEKMQQRSFKQEFFRAKHTQAAVTRKTARHPVASAAGAVKDLRPLRGALRASLTASSLRLFDFYRELALPLVQQKTMRLAMEEKNR